MPACTVLGSLIIGKSRKSIFEGGGDEVSEIAEKARARLREWTEIRL